MSILFGVVVACSDPSVGPPPPSAENAERVVHDHYLLWYRDSDADGHGDATVTLRGRVRPDGYVGDATDCDDHNAAVSPTAPEVYANNLDDDCDGDVDEESVVVTTADVSVGIDEEYAYLGERMASADLDADGIADLAIGAKRRLGDGSVYLLYGPASGSVAAEDLVSISASVGPAIVTYLGSGVGAGDANGDAMDDLLVAASNIDEYYLFLGPITADLSTTDADAVFAIPSSLLVPPCVAVASDFDGDGGADLVMTSPRESTVYVASGTASGTVDVPSDAAYTFEGPYGAELGAQIAETGDTNGDGIADLALAAASQWPGEVYLVPGGLEPGAYEATDVATATFTHRTTHFHSVAAFGWSLASGDYDGDGAADLFVGAIFATSSTGVDSSGTVYGFLGPLSGVKRPADASVRWESGASGTICQLGDALAVDDLDGDETQDVAMGCHIQDEVYLQLGYETGVHDVATLIQIQPPGIGGWNWITPVHDWTGDGGSELALGTPILSGASGAYVGAVHVFFSERWQ